MKKFVIMEVVPFGANGYQSAGAEFGDCTLIDPRHVIDEERLRMGIPRVNEKFFSPTLNGWRNCAGAIEKEYLILDPPEGDKWEKDLEKAVHMISDVLHSLLQRMPRKP